MSKFNPSDPLTVGLEWRGTMPLSEPIDYGRELAIRIVPATAQTVTGASYAQVGRQYAIDRFHAWNLFTIYQQGDERATGRPTVVTTGPKACTTAGGALGGGATTAMEAVLYPGDGKYITVTGSASIDFNFFQPSYTMSKVRILDVTITLGLDRANATVASSLTSYWSMPTTVTTAVFNIDPSGYPAGSGGLDYTLDFGEIFLGGYFPLTDGRRRPFLKGDLTNLDNGTIKFRIQNTTGSTTVHHATMTVTYCEENRVATGGYAEGNGASWVQDPASAMWRKVSQIIDVGTGSPGTVLTAGTPYLVSLTRAKDVAITNMARDGIGSSPNFQFGEGRRLAAIRPADPDVVQCRMARRLDTGLLAEDFMNMDRGCAMALCGPGGGNGVITQGVLPALTQPYSRMLAIESATYTQGVSSPIAGAYPTVRFLCRRVGEPTDLTVTSASGANAVLTNAAYDAIDKDEDGWADVTLTWSSPVPLAANVNQVITFATGTGSNRWLLPLMLTDSGDFYPSTYGGSTQTSNFGAHTDFAVTLSTAVPPVTGCELARGFLPLMPVDETCTDPLVRSVDYVNFCWGDVPVVSGSPLVTGSPLVSGFCAWQVERRDQIDPVWRRIGNMTERGITCLPDYEARIGVWSDYRVRMSRQDGVAGPWSSAGGYVTVPATAGCYMTVDGVSAFTAGQDGTFIARIAPTSWRPAADQTIMARYGAAGSKSWMLQLTTTGALKLQFSTDGTNSFSFPSGQPINLQPGEAKWVAATIEVDHPINVWMLRYWLADDGVNWTQLGGAAVSGPAVTGLYPAATVPVTLGVQSDGTTQKFSGQISAAAIASGIREADGGPVGYPLFAFNGATDLLGIDPTLTSFESTSGHIVNLSGAGTTIVPSGVTRLGASSSPLPPIVTGGCDALILTSNEDPDQTVAAPMMFPGGSAPEETFTFPESDTVTLQRLHMRDYQVAFRPLERGGVRFQRTLLLNAITVPARRLDAYFQTLRDLAWDDLSYVCVLDQRGGRWYATVLVPDGTIREVNQVYMGSIDVIETTNVPTVINVEAV